MAAKVIFTAVADRGGHFGPFSEDRTLVFDTEITNIGGGYSASSGIFTAPSLGVYYFTFFYHASNDCKSGLTLMKNSEVIVRSFDNSARGSDFCDNAGNAAFLKLDAGDKVFVRLAGENHVYASNRTTTFSGFLVN